MALYPAVMIAAALFTASRAAGQEVPVLNQYATSRWMYFADERDAGLCFETAPDRPASNVWVAVSLSPIGREINSKVETWIDRHGRPHSLAVLKTQLEFNDLITRERFPYGGAHRYAPNPIPDRIEPVLTTGILDRPTLLIPVWKAELRLARLRSRVRVERGEPGSVAAKYADYLSEKVSVAAKSAAALEAALRAVVVRSVSGGVPLPPHEGYSMSGLRGLDAPYGSGDELVVRESNRGFVRFDRSPSNPAAEDAVREFVDQEALSAEIVETLKRYEEIMTGDLEAASSICRDLFAPPCP